MEAGASLRISEDAREDFRAEARSTHAEQHRVLVPRRLLTQRGERIFLHLLPAGGGEPAEPLALVLARPERRIALPKPARPRLAARLLQPRLDSFLERFGKLRIYAGEPVAQERRALARDRAEQRVGRVRELLDAILDEARW